MILSLTFSSHRKYSKTKSLIQQSLEYLTVTKHNMWKKYKKYKQKISDLHENIFQLCINISRIWQRISSGI